MVAMVSKIKAITGQLNIKGKFLGSMPSCSTEVPYISNTLTLPPPPKQRIIQRSDLLEVQYLKQLLIFKCPRSSFQASTLQAQPNYVHDGYCFGPIMATLIPTIIAYIVDMVSKQVGHQDKDVDITLVVIIPYLHGL